MLVLNGSREDQASQFASQFRSRHPVHPGGASVAFNRREGLAVVFGRDRLFHQVLVHRFLSEGSRIGIVSPSPRAWAAAPLGLFGTR